MVGCTDAVDRRRTSTKTNSSNVKARPSAAFSGVLLRASASYTWHESLPYSLSLKVREKTHYELFDLLRDEHREAATGDTRLLP